MAGPGQTRSYGKIVALATVSAVAILAILFWQSKHRTAPSVSSSNPTTVAVLPFQNMSADPGVDFLRLALPDEIATTLSYVHSLSIRPFATTSKYNAPNVDLEQAGRDMRVTQIVTGHYLKEGDQLQITLEAVDVANNRSVWRDTINVGALDMIAMRGQINGKVRQGLVPALVGGENSAEAGTHPRNEEAYDLYLRSVSMPHDAAPNKEAITMLERAIGLDSTYAPSWRALGERYYYDAHYSNGGEAVLQRSAHSLEHALALDPDYSDAASLLITNRVEKGELAQAYRDAKALVERHPENGMAHFALSYVLRYGGIMDEAARECDTALSLDPGNYQLRSCAFVFELSGHPERGMQFLQLDAGSEWTAPNLTVLYLRQAKQAEARESVKMIPASDPVGKLLTVCANEAPASEIEKAAHEAMPALLADPDAENRYWDASVLAWCGQKDLAMRLLKSSIEGHYCSYTALQKDALMAKLRDMPEFSQLMSAAKQCQDNFLAEREQASH